MWTKITRQISLYGLSNLSINCLVCQTCQISMYGLSNPSDFPVWSVNILYGLSNLSIPCMVCQTHQISLYGLSNLSDFPVWSVKPVNYLFGLSNPSEFPVWSVKLVRIPCIVCQYPVWFVKSIRNTCLTCQTTVKTSLYMSKVRTMDCQPSSSYGLFAVHTEQSKFQNGGCVVCTVDNLCIPNGLYTVHMHLFLVMDHPLVLHVIWLICRISIMMAK